MCVIKAPKTMPADNAESPFITSSDERRNTEVRHQGARLAQSVKTALCIASQLHERVSEARELLDHGLVTVNG